MANDEITFPRDFRPNALIPLGLCVLLVLGIGGIWSVAHHYPLSQVAAPAIPTLIAAVGLVLASTFVVRVDDTGITQRSLLGMKTAEWDKITRVDRFKTAYSVHDRDGKDLILLSILTDGHQKAIANEVIARRGLQPARQKPERPVSERWI